MKKYINYLIPIFITFLIICFIFITNGLYPFGSNSIVQVDADYQFIPVLYRIYDFLHGNASIIYDDIGLGNSIYTSMIIQGSIFSPINLILFFTSRSNIVNYFNIILMVKLCLLSFATYIFINNTYKVKEYYKILFSILYTFCGWILFNYFNIMWLDCIILFPLIVMFLNKLLSSGKYIGYIITLSLSLIISYYISYYILLFILFYSFTYIMSKVSKENIKKVIFKLGFCTLIALLISSFSIIPSLYQTIISSRFDSNGSSQLFDCIMEKSLHLLFSPLFLILFGKLILKYKDDKINVLNYLTLFVLFSIGIFIEPINLAIHGGSHWSFPYRYSFIALFILMSGSLYYIEKYKKEIVYKYQKINLVLYLILCLLLIFIGNIYYKSIQDAQIVLDFKDKMVYVNIILIVLISICMYLLSIGFKNKYIKYASITISCLLQVFIFASFTMYYSDGYFLTRNSNEINNNLSIVKNNRYNKNYLNYTPDYPFIYNVGSIDNWLHILPDSEINTYNNLGYETSDTCMRGYGGTIFTDWLFDIKYLISDKELNDDLYELVDSYDKKFYLYKYTYKSGFGILYNVKFSYDDVSSFDLQNEIYNNLFNNNKNIIDTKNYVYNDTDTIDFSYNISEKGFLYINFDKNYDIDYIKINDNYIYDIKDYIKYMGIYDTNISIQIKLKEINDDYIDYSIGFIKYNDIIKLSNNNQVKYIKDGYSININNNNSFNYLFLPVNNIKGLETYVNNRKVKIDNYIDNFVSIKLDKGDNNVIIKYKLPYLGLGIILSMIGLLLFIVYKYINISNKIILNITYYLYFSIIVFVYFYLYVYSLFKYYG